MRKVNKAGVELVKSFEGCKLESYADPASPLAVELKKAKPKRAAGWEKLSGEPWTIGWGSTGLDHFNLDAKGQPTRIGPGLKWTQEQADEREEIDLAKFGAQVEALVSIKVSDNQFAALVSFAYNCGIGNLKSSTLLRKVNESKFQEAAMEFLKWDKAQGKVMLGLTRRREAEKALFLKPDEKSPIHPMCTMPQ
jgi:lysozyme